MEKYILVILPPSNTSHVCKVLRQRLICKAAEPELGKLAWEEPSPPDLLIILRRDPWEDAGPGFAQPLGDTEGEHRAAAGYDKAALCMLIIS